MNTMATILCGLALAALSAASLRMDGHVLSPRALQSGLWAVLLLLYGSLPHGLYPLSLEVLLVIVAGCFAFAAGAQLTIGRPSTVPRVDAGSQRPTWVRDVIFWLPLLALPFVLQRAAQLAESSAFTESAYVNLRIALTWEDQDNSGFGVLAYATPMAFCSAVVELLTSCRRWFAGRGWISLLVSMIYAGISTGRTFFLLLIIGLAGVALLTRRTTLREMSVLVLAAVLVMFFGVGLALDKLGPADEGGAALAAIQAFLVYLLGGTAALDAAMDTMNSFGMGANALRSILAVLSALGFPVEVVPLIKDYAYVPEPTNVFTVFRPYLEDLGIHGVVLAMLFLGSLQGLLFVRARAGDLRFVGLYAISLYPLAMQFFQDQYFSLLTSWLIMGVLIAASVAPATIARTVPTDAAHA